jgi:hypothetical protein
MRPDRLPCTVGVRVAARMNRADEARRITSEPLDASEPEHLWLVFELSGSDCTTIITNTPHNTDEACAIVRNLVALVEGQHAEFAATLFRASQCGGNLINTRPAWHTSQRPSTPDFRPHERT